MANVLGTLFQNIADAIREKTGESGTLKPADFPAEILSIITGSDSSGDASSGESSGTVSGATPKPMRYKRGSFYPSSGRAIIQHDLGTVPDMILVLNSKCGYGYGTIINSLGFSRQVLDACPDLMAHSWFCFNDYEEQLDSAPFILDNAHREPMEEITDSANEGGFIRGVTASSFIIGHDSYPKLMTEYADGEKAYYTWYAISGLLNVVTTTEGTYKLTFLNNDGKQIYERLVFSGDDCPDPVAQGKLTAPTRESTVSHHFTFSGWSETNGGSASASALQAVTESRLLYAAYTATVRQYTVRFFDGGTLLSTAQVNYNSYATPPNTDRADYRFVGWDKDPSATPITGDTDFYGTWEVDDGWMQLRETITIPENVVPKCVCVGDGSRMVVGYNKVLKYYDISTVPATLISTTGLLYAVRNIAVSGDGSTIALDLAYAGTSLGSAINLYKVTESGLTYFTGPSVTMSTATSSSLSANNRVGLNRDGTVLATYTIGDNIMRVLKWEDGAWSVKVEAAVSAVSLIALASFAFSPDDSLLVFAYGATGYPVMYDLRTMTDVTATYLTSGNSNKVGHAAFSPDGKYLVTGVSRSGSGAPSVYGTVYDRSTVPYTAQTYAFGGGSSATFCNMMFDRLGSVLFTVTTNTGEGCGIYSFDAGTWERRQTEAVIPAGNKYFSHLSQNNLYLVVSNCASSTTTEVLVYRLRI